MNYDEKIKAVLDTPYERMYPFEIEKELFLILKEAEKNDDEKVKQEILWEIDLINRTFGHKGTYEGEEVEEISNKWKFYLETDKNNFTKPFFNMPFCEWKEEALDYYKKRIENTSSELSKARYAFAIMTFSSESAKLDYAKKSFNGWLNTAEKYVNDNKYSDFYEIPSFAYDFSIKLSLSFGQNELLDKAIKSLHKSIFKIIKEGDKRWNLDLFEIESKYLNQISNKIDSETLNLIKKESLERIKEILSELEQKKMFHFMRSYIKCLIEYSSNEEHYKLKVNLAESYIKEAEERKEEPLVQSSFLSCAIKEYKLMQSGFSDKKEEINNKIKGLSLRLKDINNKVNYKTISTQITITNKQIKEYIEQLKHQESNIFYGLLKDFSLFPKKEDIEKQIIEQKKTTPLQFIIPITVYSGENIVKKHISEESIFDYQLRHRILIAIKIAELALKMTMEGLQKEINIMEEINKLLNVKDIEDIKITLQKGFSFLFDDTKDYISSAHLLVPYIEEIIRRIIIKSDQVDSVIRLEKQKVTKEKTISLRKIELGGLLSNDNVRGIIGIDFADNLKVFLTDVDQENFRNLLLHGLLESNKINETSVLFLAYILLKLIFILKEIKPIEKNEN